MKLSKKARAAFPQFPGKIVAHSHEFLILDSGGYHVPLRSIEVRRAYWQAIFRTYGADDKKKISTKNERVDMALALRMLASHAELRTLASHAELGTSNINPWDDNLFGKPLLDELAKTIGEQLLKLALKPANGAEDAAAIFGNVARAVVNGIALEKAAPPLGNTAPIGHLMWPDGGSRLLPRECTMIMIAETYFSARRVPCPKWWVRERCADAGLEFPGKNKPGPWRSAFVRAALDGLPD